MHLYLATDLVAIDGYAGPDVDERLEVQRLPWREAVAMAEAGASRTPSRSSACCTSAAWPRPASSAEPERPTEHRPSRPRSRRRR